MAVPVGLSKRRLSTMLVRRVENEKNESLWTFQNPIFLDQRCFIGGWMGLFRSVCGPENLARKLLNFVDLEENTLQVYQQTKQHYWQLIWTRYFKLRLVLGPVLNPIWSGFQSTILYTEVGIISENQYVHQEPHNVDLCFISAIAFLSLQCVIKINNI